MSIFEITLAVILTLLGLAILAILLARWTRRKQNETYMSRYSSEQSTGLLDSEDDKDYSSRRSKRGRGFRHSYSTESDISYGDQGSKGYCTPSNNSLALSQSNVALPQGSVSHTKCIRAAQEPLSGAVGPISGTIGPIMQFTAPVPGATGPIKLTQKTIVQTPGPIVQYTGSSSAEPSEMNTAGSTSGPSPAPHGMPLAPLMISQRTTTRPGQPTITPIPIGIAHIPTVDSSGKINWRKAALYPDWRKEEFQAAWRQTPSVEYSGEIGGLMY
ncbi:testis-expressed basic protein 1 isoform X5 [Oryctolagus cuniculus]|uniref:testis-expressed basic protein 1 isoform X5 n=1 Tax=Oryctolagus cuniculus TaxID=9986 RepID=UPI0038792206